MEKSDFDTVELTTVEAKSPAMVALLEYVRELKAKIKRVEENQHDCQQGCHQRLTRLEHYNLGIDGTNGFKELIRDNEKRIDTLEKSLAQWVTRLITAMLILDVVVLPLLLWIFFNFVPLRIQVP